MTRTSAIIIILFPYMTLAQTNTNDSVPTDSLEVYLDNLVNNWDPSSQPWTFITFQLEKPRVTISYGQQSIHPFLAEYNRKIHFSTPNYSTDTLDMFLNTGGRTLIDIYSNKFDSLILQDNFGQYFFNIQNHKYSELLFKQVTLLGFEHIGKINGQTSPLRFERAKKK